MKYDDYLKYMSVNGMSVIEIHMLSLNGDKVDITRVRFPDIQQMTWKYRYSLWINGECTDSLTSENTILEERLCKSNDDSEKRIIRKLISNYYKGFNKGIQNDKTTKIGKSNKASDKGLLRGRFYGSLCID